MTSKSAAAASSSSAVTSKKGSSSSSKSVSSAAAASSGAEVIHTPETGTVPVPMTSTATLEATIMPEVAAASPDASSTSADGAVAVADNVAAPEKKPKAIRIPLTKLEKWLKMARDASSSARLETSTKMSTTLASHIESFITSKVNGSTSKTNRPLSGYNLYVQQHIAEVAAANPGISNKDIMTKIAELWRNRQRTEPSVPVGAAAAATGK